jgi:tetratricopeptide (TPR) repeat protein
MKARLTSVQRLLLASLIGASIWIGAIGPVEAGLRETFEAGNEAFWSGDFEGAARSYEQLVELGVWDADVFHNLGTAYARQGQLGRAILNLERALLIQPGHEDARENLATVRRVLARQRTAEGQDADIEPPRSFWMNTLQRVTSAQVVIPFLICWVGLFVLLGARRLTKSEVARLALLIVALIFGIGAGISGTMVFGKASYDSEVCEAIAITTARATLREGPGERFGRAFDAGTGDRLRVLDREGEWIHLRDREGREGWGRSSDFGELRQR